MLTPRENFIETVKKNGHPDRYVKQFEAIHLLMETPYNRHSPEPWPGQMEVVNGWGITNSWPEGFPGMFPVHDEAHIVCKNVEDWKKYVHAPEILYPEEEWEHAIQEAEKVDRNQFFVSPFISPGVFEQCHYLMGMQNCLIAFYEDPEEMKDMIKYIVEWNIRYADQIFKYIKPDLWFQHDDWGTQISTFISPEMFEEFLMPSYKEMYAYYKENNIKYIVHHSDSYGKTLVPYMIDLGIDVWQGAVRSNRLGEIVKRYGDRLTIMGGVDSALVDREDWTEENVLKEVEKICKECGISHFIPCQSQGGPMSTYNGVYEAINTAIDICSEKMF